ncbi:MAG: DMT family transporter [Pseudomonadota bacterium]
MKKPSSVANPSAPPPLRRTTIDAQGAVLLVFFSALMGLNQPLVKIVNSGLQPVFQAGLRSACAFVPILLFALVMRKRLSLSDGSFWPGVFCGVLFATEFVMLFLALDFTTVARSSIFFYTMPFWVAVAAPWLIPGEHLTPRKVLGLAMAVAGVAVALLLRGGESVPLPETHLLGDLLCLGAAILWAGIALTARATALSRASPEMQLLYQLAVSTPLLLGAALFFGPLVRDFTPEIGAIFAFQVLVVVCVGFLTWFWVLSVYPASDMASFGFLAPVFGVFFGWLILGEDLTPSLIAALVLVGIGIFLVSWKPRARG